MNTNLTYSALMGILLLLLSSSFSVLAGERDFYQIKIYSIESEVQEQRMDSYLEEAYIPALHRAGISKVGVFKTVDEQAEAGNQIYVLIPFSSVTQFEGLEARLSEDKEFQKKSSDYTLAAHDNPPYVRIESILLKAFKSMPGFRIPTHGTPKSQQIYELRSYQSATEKLYQKKVEMFNEGGESRIFMDLGFQPVFFGEVISGPVMPNLMYMTTFRNMESQKKHWKAFIDSPAWIKLKEEKQYANTVSHIDKYFLYPAEYSEL